jgi:alpha-L-rhamnosidase
MGVLKPEDWSGAQWIGLNEDQEGGKNRLDRSLPARMRRKEIELGSVSIKRAAAYISGLGLSELYINGEKVSDHVLSPCLTDYDKRVPYVTHPVHLLPGTP